MENKYRNIVFIGFASCGKTAAGRITADRLGFKFIDLDEAIEERFTYDTTKMLKCREIYNTYGVEYFTELETRVLGSLLVLESSVLSTGGGAPMTEANRPILKKIGFTVYLYAEPPVLIERMKSKGYPAFLADNPTVENLEKIWNIRHSVYKKMADLTIDTNQMNIEMVVTEVLKIYGQYNR